MNDRIIDNMSRQPFVTLRRSGYQWIVSLYDPNVGSVGQHVYIGYHRTERRARIAARQITEAEGNFGFADYTRDKLIWRTI